MLKFHRSYFILTIILFTAEYLIGKYMHDKLIRPYGGDFLVVILLYCLIKSFLNKAFLPVAIVVLCVAYVVEITQYFHLIKLLGLQHSTPAALILGTSFSWTDICCYTLGITLVVGIEKIKLQTGKTEISNV